MHMVCVRRESVRQAGNRSMPIGERPHPVRIVVTGTSGAGKTTFARRVATALGIPHIELDALNWQPGWRALSIDDPQLFARHVAEAVAADRWVSDGNYGLVREIIWSRATHLVWLDYGRPVVMARVLRRSFVRAVLRTELWPGTGNSERWRAWFRPSHPIRWAWSTWARRRRETAERLKRPEFAHLVVLRVAHPRQAPAALHALRASRTATDHPRGEDTEATRLEVPADPRAG